MLPDLNNLSYSDIHLINVGYHRCDFLLWLLLLTLLLLLFLLRLLLLILLGLLLLWMRLLGLLFIGFASGLLSFTVGDLLQLRHLLKLSFRWALCMLIWEGAEDLLGLNLLKHAG